MNNFSIHITIEHTGKTKKNEKMKEKSSKINDHV